MTVLNKNPVTPRLPVTPPKGLLVPADRLLSRLPGLRILVSQKREGKLVRSSLLPAPQLRTFSTPCPPPHTSLSPRNTHTPQPLSHTAHLSSQAPLWLPGREGTPWIIWLTSPHSELPLGCLLHDPCQDFSIFFSHTSKVRELTTSQDRLLFGPL